MNERLVRYANERAWLLEQKALGDPASDDERLSLLRDPPRLVHEANLRCVRLRSRAAEISWRFDESSNRVATEVVGDVDKSRVEVPPSLLFGSDDALVYARVFARKAAEALRLTFEIDTNEWARVASLPDQPDRHAKKTSRARRSR